MGEDAPTAPADPRPGGEPYFIDSECPECGTTLTQIPDAEENGWHDEWECRQCQNGVHMDWPEDYRDEIFGRVEDLKDLDDDELVSLDELDDLL